MASKLLGNLDKGLIFILSAPAGTGKTTLARMLIHEFPTVKFSVSCTTREPRPGEVEGIDYYFLSKTEFKEKIAKGDFLEYAEVFGHFYGTSKQQVNAVCEAGYHVLLVIDTQGAMKLKQVVDATYVFLSPPSLEELEQRLIKRHTETSDLIQQRLEWAQIEMQRIKYYDYLIINEDLEIAYQILKSIVIAEGHKVKTNKKE